VSKKEIHEMAFRQAYPIAPELGEVRIRFILEKTEVSTEKNEGPQGRALPMPFKTVRVETRTSGEIDVPEQDLIIFLRGYIPGGKK
jgi:hypothetical protein